MNPRASRIVFVPAIALVASTALPAQADERPDYYLLLSVACRGVVDEGVGHIGWHPEVAGIDPKESVSVFKAFAAPDTTACLKGILERDPALTNRIRNQDQATDTERADIRQRIREAWDRFGVGDALEEVAVTGRRGPRVAALLSACAAPHTPPGPAPPVRQ